MGAPDDETDDCRKLKLLEAAEVVVVVDAVVVAVLAAVVVVVVPPPNIDAEVDTIFSSGDIVVLIPPKIVDVGDIACGCPKRVDVMVVAWV